MVNMSHAGECSHVSMTDCDFYLRNRAQFLMCSQFFEQRRCYTESMFSLTKFRRKHKIRVLVWLLDYDKGMNLYTANKPIELGSNTGPLYIPRSQENADNKLDAFD